MYEAQGNQHRKKFVLVKKCFQLFSFGDYGVGTTSLYGDMVTR